MRKMIFTFSWSRFNRLITPVNNRSSEAAAYIRKTGLLLRHRWVESWVESTPRQLHHECWGHRRWSCLRRDYEIVHWHTRYLKLRETIQVPRRKPKIGDLSRTRCLLHVFLMDYSSCNHWSDGFLHLLGMVSQDILHSGSLKLLKTVRNVWEIVCRLGLVAYGNVNEGVLRAHLCCIGQWQAGTCCWQSIRRRCHLISQALETKEFRDSMSLACVIAINGIHKQWITCKIDQKIIAQDTALGKGDYRYCFH